MLWIDVNIGIDSDSDGNYGLIAASKKMSNFKEPLTRFIQFDILYESIIRL